MPTLPNYPAGGRIVFQTDRDGNEEIYVMGCDGSGQTNLTNNPANDRGPSWASGGKIAFSSNRNVDGGYDIYLITLSPWNIERLTTNAADDESPALSPDGSKVAYVSYRDGGTDPEIYVLTVSDRSLVQITDNTAKDLDPDWSSDGHRLAFGSDRDGNFDIFSANADGSGVEKITSVSHNLANDRWPDLGEYSGKEVIAFASDRNGDWDVYVYDEIDGLRVTTDNIGETLDAEPNWGPSGDGFVFHTNRDINANFEIYRANDSFGDFNTNITRNGYSESHESNESSPDWEPVDDGVYCGE